MNKRSVKFHKDRYKKEEELRAQGGHFDIVVKGKSDKKKPEDYIQTTCTS